MLSYVYTPKTAEESVATINIKYLKDSRKIKAI